MSVRLSLRLVEVVVWGSLMVLPLVAGEWRVTQVAQFLCYGLFAMSLALIWGQCGLLCFGHAIFFGIGAYVMSLTTLGLLPGMEQLSSSYLGLLLAMLFPALFAQLLGRFLFSGRGLEGAYFAIVTLAIAVIAERLAVNWDYIGGLNGLMGVPGLKLGPFSGYEEISEPRSVYYWTLCITVAAYVLLQALVSSRYGVVLRAIRENEVRTGFFGYDTAAYKVTAFTLAAAVAGLAGALFVTQFGFASPPLIGFGLSTEVLIWVALGGRTLLLAAFLGALFVRSLEGVLADWFGPYWLLGLGGVFVGCVILFPRGLFGELLLRGQAAQLPFKRSRSL